MYSAGAFLLNVCVGMVFHKTLLAVLAFSDAFDRKTAETLMFSVVILLIIFLFVYFGKKPEPGKTQ